MAYLIVIGVCTLLIAGSLILRERSKRNLPPRKVELCDEATLLALIAEIPDLDAILQESDRLSDEYDSDHRALLVQYGRICSQFIHCLPSGHREFWNDACAHLITATALAIANPNVWHVQLLSWISINNLGYAEALDLMTELCERDVVTLEVPLLYKVTVRRRRLGKVPLLQLEVLRAIITSLVVFSAEVAGADWAEVDYHRMAISKLLTTYDGSYELDRIRDTDYPGSAETTKDQELDDSSVEPTLSPLYELLGVSCNATEDELTRAYRERVKEWHPDRLDGMAAELKAYATAQMARVNAAYAVLKNHSSDSGPR